MSLTATIETNPECFKTLTSEWLELLNRAHTNTVFQTPQFLSSWWESLGFGTLQIIVVRDDQHILRGIAPLFLQPLSTGSVELNFVGCVNVSDYLDVVVDRDYSEAVYSELHTVLTTQIKWDSLFWCSVPENSPTRAFIQKQFAGSSESVQDVTPKITLPIDWETYLSSLDRKQRHELKRKWRRLDELDHTFVCISEKEAAVRCVETFIMLHKASSVEKRDFWNDEHLIFFRKFVPTAAEQGWLKLFFLEVNGEAVATMLIFDYNNIYNLYNSGFLPEKYAEVGTGATLTAYTIKDAITQGRGIYDFLRGGEQYKIRLGAVAGAVYDLRVASKNH